MWYEVHPTPVKGEDGKNLVYVRPKSGMKLTMRQLEDQCERYNALRYGELSRAFEAFIRVASRFMAEGYRIETPIGSFAPRLKVGREITDPDDVKGSDVHFDGVEYNSGKLWHKSVEKWLDGFRLTEKTNVQEVLANPEKLEAKLQECLRKFNGYVTVTLFRYHTGLTYYSARKQLNEWTKGENPKLLKTKR